MEKLTLQLSGYFDHNFGDDYMMKIIVHYLPEIEFVVAKNEKISRLLLEEKNVRLMADGEKGKYPVLIVTGSGFMINSAIALKVEIKSFLKREKAGDYCLGCNIEPFKSKLRELLIRHKLSKLRLIVCRDTASFKWLRKNLKTDVRQLPDILFSIPEEWLKMQADAVALGISVMNIGKDGADYYKKMAEIADFYVQQTGNEVFLMAFDTGDEDDVCACELVKGMCKEKDFIKLVCHGDNSEIIDAYSKCRKIVGARFHSVVLALRMGIDVYPIIYRKKTENILSDIRYTGKKSYINQIESQEIKDFLLSEEKAFSNYKIFNCENKYPQILREILSKI